MPDPVNYLAGMQDPQSGNFLRALQGGIQAGLQTPTLLEQQAQQESINTSRLNQSIVQNKAVEEQKLREQQQKASEYYFQTLQKPDATPEELQRAEDAVSYFNPEFGKFKEATRKNQSALVNGFGEESAFGLYNAIRSKNPELIASEFDRYKTAAESRPELKTQAQMISKLYDTYQKDPNLAQGIIRNAAFSANPDKYKKVWEAEGEQQKVEGVGVKPIDKDTFDQELKLAKEYETAVAPYQKVKESYGNIINAEKTPAGNISLIYNYMKVLDPGSVVRESEFAQAQNAGALPTRISNLFSQVTSGTRLSDDQIKDIESQSKKLLTSAGVKEAETRKGIARRAKAYGLDPSRIFNMEVESVPQVQESEKKPSPKPNLTPYDPNKKDTQVAPYGERADGTPKGEGWLGALKMKDGSDNFATELSVGVNIDGKEREIPTLVPTLSKSEIEYLLKGGDPRQNNAIMGKAVAHASKLIKKGSSPFVADSLLPSGGGEEIGTPSLIPLISPGGVKFNLEK